MLVEQIDRARTTCNLSSAIRVFVFNRFRGKELPARGLAADPVEGRL
jgi:predicted DNA-binding ribbon-helix-helix protein